jgi:hypothetical protein
MVTEARADESMEGCLVTLPLDTFPAFSSQPDVSHCTAMTVGFHVSYRNWGCEAQSTLPEVD